MTDDAQNGDRSPERADEPFPHRGRVIRELVRFAGALRREGLAVPADATVVAARALLEVGAREPSTVRDVLRASLVTEPDPAGIFDRLFPAFWRRLDGAGGIVPRPDARFEGARATGTNDPAAGPHAAGTPQGADADGDDASEAVTDRRQRPAGFRPPDPGFVADGDGDETERTAAYGALEGAQALDDDLVGAVDPRISSAVAGLVAAIADRPGRRPTRAGAGAIDARRALRDSFSTGGTPVDLPRRGPKPVTVRPTVLVDVSRSVLDAVDRTVLLAFLHALVARSRGARVFFFDTDLEEVTGEFESGSLEATVAALERAQARWGGGTKIGASIETLRRRYPDAVDRRTVAFVVSDGLDTGDVEAVERGVTWLARRSRLLFWLNPLAGLPGYEPTCRGMAAAAPYLDGLFAFDGPAALEELVAQLERRGVAGPLGYRFETRA